MATPGTAKLKKLKHVTQNKYRHLLHMKMHQFYQKIPQKIKKLKMAIFIS